MLIDYSEWSPLCVSFALLGGTDIRSYLKRKNVISKIEQDDLIMNEKNLIANRLRLEIGMQQWRWSPLNRPTVHRSPVGH